MLNIGERISELRKKNGWSQNELAKKVEASRDIIGKYERNDNSPSIEMALKLAKIFNVSVDFLLGEGKYSSYDKEMLRRLEDIENLDQDTKHMLFKVVDTFLRDAKTRQAYS